MNMNENESSFERKIFFYCAHPVHLLFCVPLGSDSVNHPELVKAVCWSIMQVNMHFKINVTKVSNVCTSFKMNRVDVETLYKNANIHWLQQKFRSL